MKRCGTTGAHAQLCLDACNGFYGRLPGYDKFTYRYYIPGPQASGECAAFIENGGDCSRQDSKCCVSVLPTPADYFPYTLGCLQGCRAGDDDCQLSALKGVTDEYIPDLSNSAIGVIASSSSSSDESGAGIDITSAPTAMPTTTG